MVEKYNFEDAIPSPESSSRTITADGYLTAPAVLARAGVFKYRARELGVRDHHPDDMVAVYRSAAALAKGVESFEAQAITLDHQWTTSANWRTNAIGDVRDVEMRADDMVGTLIVRDADAIRQVNGGKTQLSNGYSATVVRRPGEYQGQAYEYEQENFVGNHIAIVSAARCGSACRIADSAETETHIMITRTFDGLTATLENEQSGQIFGRIVRSLDETRKELDTLRSATPRVKIGDKELDAPAVQQMLDCQCQEIAALKKAQQTPEEIQKLVVERSNAIAAAKEMMPEIKIGDGDTAHTIHVTALDYVREKDETAKAQLDAAFGTQKLADAEPGAVSIAFRTISAGLKKAREARKVHDSRMQIGRIADATEPKGEKDARQAFIERQANSWKSKEVN